MSRSEDIRVFLKERRTVFQNSKFRVFSDHVIDSAGREVTDYLVAAPRVSTGDMITGVTVLPITDAGIVLLRTYRHALGRTILEAVRGFVDAGETPEQAALRELSEETGLLTTPDRLIPLGTCAPEASTLAARVALFAAEGCRPGPRTDAGEVGLGPCAVFSRLAVEQMVRDMTIEDVTTALCLHRRYS